MGTLSSFMSTFGAPAQPPSPECVASIEAMAPEGGGGLAKFIAAFNGVTESFWFYNHTIELRFEPKEHVYYLVGPLGGLIKQDGVTTVCHIIDRSPALIPWAAKMVIQKLLATIPTFTTQGIAGGTLVHVPEMSLEDFTKIALEAKKAPDDILEEAGDIGHMAHTWLEYYIKAILAGHTLEVESKLLNRPKDERAASCVCAALGWEHRHNVRWVATERKIYSKKYQVAGTLDGLALVDSCDDPICCPIPFKDRLSLIDWKSSNYLYIEYLYQTAIYQEAIMEEFGETHGDAELDEDGKRIFDAIAKYGAIQDRWVNRLGKEDGEFEPWHTTAEDFQEDLEGFLDCLSLVRSTKLTKERIKGQKATVRAARKAAKELVKEQEKADKKKARAEERESNRIAKEAAKMEERKAKAQAKLDAKAAKLKGVDNAKTPPEIKTEPLNAVSHVYVPAPPQPVRPSITLTIPTGLPVEVLAPRPAIALPEEKL